MPLAQSLEQEVPNKQKLFGYCCFEDDGDDDDAVDD